ncbi:GntR family transcriptional regulator [Trichococcus ilyis]|uniref:GntR family transcriptional regulator n=1 Tax=Trichococcus ilyis TaxID=640938 RepID=A0A143YNY6_9LACT|nr:GntR family transcriptional regulator [Trichococcus ilyis]CZQ93740.1 transcription regulator hth gntr [Trichococcus ilyis]SEI98763.1 GntR family transcriptional regulator [Trichococcus ilyis]
MKVMIQHNSMVPIYEQLVNQIKSLILEGSLQENASLPSVRVLAKEIKASALTVKKAYDLLEQEGFIATVHGKGSFVLAVNRHAKRENLLYSTQAELEQVIKKARQAGISITELADLVAVILEEE